MSSAVPIALAPVTGGTALLALAPGDAAKSLAPQNIAMKAAGLDAKPGSAPAAAAGPQAPSLSDAAKIEALNEQKRASMTGPSDTTNVGGAKGILTDPKAKYVTGKLLGGA